MTRTMIPAIVAFVAIIGLSFYEGYAMKDRWGEPGAEAALLGERFRQVPKTIGDWEGEDLPVDEVVRKTAGAVSYVSRRYVNNLTNQQVVLWLIVGHSRDIVRHTPNICYPSSGFRQTGPQLREVVKYGSKEAEFYTAKFEREDAFSRNIDRVFWTFNHPDTNKWEAPTDGARTHYGLAKALYKLYFTSAVAREEDTADENAAIPFAEEMLPAIDAALFPTEASQTAEPPSEADPAESENEADEIFN